MKDLLGPRDDAETPLSPEERDGIIPSYITLRGELNAAESASTGQPSRSTCASFSMTAASGSNMRPTGVTRLRHGSTTSWSGFTVTPTATGATAGSPLTATISRRCWNSSARNEPRLRGDA